MNQKEYQDTQEKIQKFNGLNASLYSCECALEFLIGIDIYVVPKFELCISHSGKERHRLAISDIGSDPAKLLAALVPFIQEKAALIRAELEAL